MPKQLRSQHRVRLDPLQAVKRAFMHRGIVIGGQHSRASKSQTDIGPSHRSTTNQKIRLESTLSAGADKPETIRSMGRKNAAKGSTDSKSAKGPSNLVELTESSQDVLYEANTVFPFTIFPDTIKLDREKLTIADRFFWRTAKITSTPISEIMSCEANVGPLFGSLHLTFRFFTDNQRTLSFLWRKDALEMQRLIHGYIIAHRREIDTSNVDLEDLKTLLLELGQGASD
jgi:hypothetical protein